MEVQQQQILPAGDDLLLQKQQVSNLHSRELLEETDNIENNSVQLNVKYDSGPTISGSYGDLEEDEEDYVSDDDIEQQQQYRDQRSSPFAAQLKQQQQQQQQQSGEMNGDAGAGFPTTLLGGLANIPEDQELDQDLLQLNSYKITSSGSGPPSFLDSTSPSRSNLGPSLEVMNLELETALQDAEHEIHNLKEKLKSKELQLEQVQIALLTYEEELSNQFQSKEASHEHNSVANDKAAAEKSPNIDVFQRTMAKSLQLLEEQKNRELKELHGRLDEMQEVIMRLQEERDLMARDAQEMQISYENQLDRMARNAQQLVVQQDASEYEIGELLKRFKSAERERDALEMKLYEAMNQINTLSGDDAVQCLYNQVQELQQANARLTEDLKRALRVQGRTQQLRNQENESARVKGVQTPSFNKEARPTTPSSVTNSSVVRPTTPQAVQNRSVTPFGDGAVLYGTVARQLIELHETTDNLMELNDSVQQQLALCQAIDANAERSISSAFRALRHMGGESPYSETSNQSSMAEPILEGSQSLRDLQDYVREIRDNLRKAVATLEALSQEKQHLHSRIRILEACLKASGADQYVTASHKSKNQAVYGGVGQGVKKAPACENFEEAKSELNKAYEELDSNHHEMSKMEREKAELAEMVEQLENEVENMRRERDSQSRRHTYSTEESSHQERPSSVNSADSNAIQIAEEMSRKLVRIQQEKEELEDKMSDYQLENQQLKEVRQQLENQIQLLLQSQKRQQSGGIQSLVRSSSWGRRKSQTPVGV